MERTYCDFILIFLIPSRTGRFDPKVPTNPRNQSFLDEEVQIILFPESNPPLLVEAGRLTGPESACSVAADVCETASPVILDTARLRLSRGRSESLPCGGTCLESSRAPLSTPRHASEGHVRSEDTCRRERGGGWKRF